MKNLVRVLFISLLVIWFYGCQKEKQTDTTVDTTTIQQMTADNTNVDNFVDESMNDVESILMDTKSTLTLPCNAVLDSVRTLHDTVTKYITYNGLNCNQTKMRVGHVQIKHRINIHWIDAGAIVIVKHIDFKVWKIAHPDKWIVINGTKTFQNVAGGLIVQLGNSITMVQHKITGNVDITFENNTTKSWYITRQRTFTGNFIDQKLMMIVDGFGEKDGYQNLVVWGVNRNGENFYSQITQSVSYKQTCDWDPCHGVRVYTIPSDSKGATITYGYKDTQPIVGDECPNQYKIDWYKGNKSGTLYINL